MNDVSSLLPGVPLIESPLFDESAAAAGLSGKTLEFARQLHREGYAIIDFPDSEILTIASRIRERYPLSKWLDDWKSRRDGSLRMMDGWPNDNDIKRIAVNPTIIALLSQVYGRRAFPYQTLDFPIGTQQKPHTDSTHANTYPERFVCAVWVALEDIDADNGPLIYYPGSHQWPSLTNASLGCDKAPPENAYVNYRHFERAWESVARARGAEPERFFAKAGQAFIITGNLLHGGDVQHDMNRTRYSQVTHYYFEGCAYYTPLLSEPFGGTIYFRAPIDITSGAKVPNVIANKEAPQEWLEIVSPLHRRASVKTPPTALPDDFDPAGYLRLNPDVRRAGVDAATHFMQFGWNEGRNWK